MRAFVAIDVPTFSDAGPCGAHPEDHVTLHFFEDLPEGSVPEVVAVLRDVASTTAPFRLEIRGVGAFPSTQRPRVVWAGVGEGADIVSSMVDRLRRGLATRGFPTETRPFVPHLTLGRLRSARDRAWAIPLLTDPGAPSRVWVATTVEELLLKESELHPAGARHTILERVRLSP